ncbi:Nucleoside-diphosphate-sugar epimerase [Loktanella fryxellensis]|uniref:Nucleoside-diphosphate-sugar epimerase n=1 Tax=Loktanella fryxellensis TaxID=245187 RepID=A0A1H7YLG7_9RHOB|nr:NAD(P)-dependent oxidoreductase [Loktanella fryxellensis]SEM46137.1 Nucleoside-diphosphate-sugar epimerase [Loktanella fryxellensis]
MKVAVTGATGMVGHAIAAHLAGQGMAVTALGRKASPLPGVAHRPYDLDGPLPDLTGLDALVHCAFSHVPGRYRGGEGDDPDGFRRANVDGSLRLFHHAADSGVGRIIFLSSRAVHDGWPAGTPLSDGLTPRPHSLYGLVKAEVEAGLAALTRPGLATASLRATGVYGVTDPGQPHKWADLFGAFAAGTTAPSRVATEVHGDDLAAAVALLLRADAAALAPHSFNVSDILLDHHDLLTLWADVSGQVGVLPPRADSGAVSVMTCERLAALGWHPRGMTGLATWLQDAARTQPILSGPGPHPG